MEKLRMHSPDLTEQNVAKIAELFPNCVTESRDDKGNVVRAVDFDLLRQELSPRLVEGPQERYRLDWPGKREALLAANAPIAKTLRPCREESVDFDTTKNLFIEGDNLDALKLLQETYLGKVKMIYIDPPYNDGDDYVYDDDYSTPKDDYLERSNQTDDSGIRLTVNTESNGRFHSDWLTMMYPRLRLSRSLLRDDGVIFISIDDVELAGLKRICDEIFGEENFEGHIHWRRRHNQPNDATKMIGLVAEHILAYSKDKLFFKSSGVGKVELTGDFSNPDNDPRGDWASKPWKVGSDQSGSRYTITSPLGTVFDEEWMGDEATYVQLLNDGRIVFPNGGRGLPRKKYFKSEREAEGQSATNWWNHDQFGHNQEGNSILTSLMDNIKNVFSNPKPPRLLRNLMSIANCKAGDIVMDYFSGSGTIFQASSEYAFPLKTIAVQIPQALNSSNKNHLPAIEFCSQNNLPLTLAEVTKERTRRSGALFANTPSEMDLGFRVLKIDSSNMDSVYYAPDETKQESLMAQIDNVREGRTSEDLLFQALLESGIAEALTLPIKREQVSGKEVFFVDGDVLAACFEGGIDDTFTKDLASRKPLRVVFRDSGFVDSAAKINAEQIFKQLSPGTDLKVI